MLPKDEEADAVISVILDFGGNIFDGNTVFLGGYRTRDDKLPQPDASTVHDVTWMGHQTFMRIVDSNDPSVLQQDKMKSTYEISKFCNRAKSTDYLAWHKDSVALAHNPTGPHYFTGACLET